MKTFDSTRRRTPFVEEALELIRYRDLLFQWTARSIKLRYKRSFLGVVWTLLEPLMLMLILAVVFSTAFRFPVHPYPIYLLPGLLLFDFFGRSTSQMIDEMAASHNLARRIYVPRSVFAVSALLTYFVNWLIALIPLMALVLFFRHPISPALITILFGMVVTALFALGIGLLVATIGAFFPDVKLAYGVLLTGLLYATPIIYPFQVIPTEYQPLFKLNPLYHLCRLVRDPVFEGHAAPIEVWLVGISISTVVAALGWWVFCGSRKAIAYHG